MTSGFTKWASPQGQRIHVSGPTAVCNKKGMSAVTIVSEYVCRIYVCVCERERQIDYQLAYHQALPQQQMIVVASSRLHEAQLFCIGS